MEWNSQKMVKVECETRERSYFKKFSTLFNSLLSVRSSGNNYYTVTNFCRMQLQFLKTNYNNGDIYFRSTD